jgi:hypothetical protein
LFTVPLPDEDDARVSEENRIYEVRLETRAISAHRTREAAEREVAELDDRARAAGRDWHYRVEEIDTTGAYQPPPRPMPRERYTTRVRTVVQPRGPRDTVHVEVLDGDQVVAGYDRNYAMMGTFEPFRQGDDMFALVSPHYTATSVLDLRTGEIIASEEPDGRGFCPVGFYVPDWWDINSGRVLPGSSMWRPADHEWPTGDFGFVWGCRWGDDSSWKVQYLDLSDVRAGILRRDDRFGYLPLATDEKRGPKDIIKVSSWGGRREVTFHVETAFELNGSAIPFDEL